MKITKFTRICFFVFILFIAGLAYGQPSNVGLCFYSHNYNIDKRTSLILNNNEPYLIEKQNSFSVEFDVFIRNETIKFGYFFRIISDKQENFDLIINNKLQAFLVVNNQDILLKNTLWVDRWNHVNISFQKKQNIISLRLNDEIIDYPYDLSKLQTLLVNFGQCDIKNFFSNDVAPINLKDIWVYYDNKERHHWILGKHLKNRVYDELKKCPAIAHNPDWKMDNYGFWKKEAVFQTRVFPQITFDSIRNIVYILNKNELIAYSLLTRSEQRTKITQETQDKFYNHLLYDPIFSELMSYNVESNQIYFYDMNKKGWDGYQNDNNEPAHAHHNRYISKTDSCLYLFGGYGFYKYNSDFFKINLKNRERTTYDLSHTITPRYLAAMGGNTTGDKIYILGGHGAEMGRQELSPKNFTDLFEVNLKTLKAKYLFDIDKEGDKGNIYSNSLIMDQENKNIYVLAYPNKKYTSSICLKKINMETQVVETLADSIEFYFQDVSSFCDLYYSPELSRLIAVAAYSKDQQSPPSVYIYTLDYPPLKKQDVIQILDDRPDYSRIIFISALFLLLAFALFAIRKAFKEKRKASKEKRKTKKNQVEDDPEDMDDMEDPEEVPKEKSFYDAKRKSILFLGGFQVFNKDGKNITREFTPTLKYLLVLIILYTVKNSKGISSSKLLETLWFDKSDESARNNRSVNMRKLRVLMEDLGKINIINQNSSWSIFMPDDILSDYREILRLTDKIQHEEITDKDDLLHLLELLDYGTLLPNIQIEWVDNFKTDFSNTVIDTLMLVVNNSKNAFYDHPDIRLKIADALFKIDSINEEALGIKCKTLIKMGKKGLAKTTFDNFAKEYKALLGDTYSGSIKNFLE